MPVIGQLLVVAVTALGPATEGFQPGKVLTVRRRSGPLWPWADLRARGLDVAELPEPDNAAWLYLKAINRCRALPAELAAAWSYALWSGWPAGQAARQLHALLRANAGPLELVLRASRMKRCQLPYLGRPDQPLLAMNLAMLPGMRYLSDMLAVEARRLADAGDYERAFEHALAILGVGDHLGRGVTLLENVVAAGRVILASRVLADLALRGQLRPPVLGQTLKRLGPEPPLHDLSRALDNDRIIALDALEAAFERPGGLGLLWGRPLPQSSGQDGWARLKTRLLRVVLPDRTMKQELLRMYSHLSARARWKPGKARWADPYRQLLLVANVPMWNVAARRRVRPIIAAAIRFDRARCEYQMARLVLAIQLHQARAGAFPGRLEELEAALGSALPLDPFSGKGFVYRRQADGWLLYSVGENYRDDGGRSGADRYALDVVYRFPPPAVRPLSASVKTAPASAPPGADP